MSWKKVHIADICEIKSGKRIPKGFDFSPITTDYRYIRARDIKKGKVDSSDLGYISKEVKDKIARYIVQEDDVVVSIAGTIGEVGYVPSELDGVNLTENAVRLTNFTEGVFSKFVLYWLMTEWSYEYMNGVAAGSAQPKLGIYKIEQIPISLPSFEIQHRIADILSAYDDLIENNRKQTKLLEEATQRLYKEWFVDLRFPGYEHTKIVDGVPEGWGKCSLGDVIEFDPKVQLTKDRIKQFVPMSALNMSSMTLDTAELSETTSNSGSKFQNNDTLLARITPCLENGKTAFVHGIQSAEGAVGSTEYIVMRSKRLNPYMVYLHARTDGFRQSAINSMSGSDGRQRVKADKLKALPYLCPPTTVVNQFGKFAAPVFELIFDLNEQTFQAASARDRILPKLMSGETEV